MTEISYHHIFQFGNQIHLKQGVNTGRLLNDLKQFDDKWYQYNEFKPEINRQGLCILNEDGVNKPGPAISSLLEWNMKHGTNWDDEDFVVPTPVYEKCIDLKYLLEPIRPWINRTHFLKLPPGGYFPPHRDNHYLDAPVFRLIVPVANTTAPWMRFMLEDKTLQWSSGDLYAVNTTLEHTLFNAGSKDSIWIVINAKVCREMFEFVTRSTTIR